MISVVQIVQQRDASCTGLGGSSLQLHGVLLGAGLLVQPEEVAEGLVHRDAVVLDGSSVASRVCCAGCGGPFI